MGCLLVLCFCLISYNKDSLLLEYKLISIKSYTLKFMMLTLASLMFAYSHNKINDFSNNYRKIFNIFYIIVNSILILYTLIFITLLRPFQNNVENVIKVTNEVKTQYSKTANLIYYNDTYLIFILNPEKSSEERFFVKKFETLFEEEKK